MIKKITSGTQGTFFILNSEFLFEKNYNMIYSKRHLHFVFDLFLCVSLSPCLQTLRILDFFEGTLGVIPWVPDAFHARFPVSVKSGLWPSSLYVLYCNYILWLHLYGLFHFLIWYSKGILRLQGLIP